MLWVLGPQDWCWHDPLGHNLPEIPPVVFLVVHEQPLGQAREVPVQVSGHHLPQFAPSPSRSCAADIRLFSTGFVDGGGSGVPNTQKALSQSSNDSATCLCFELRFEVQTMVTFLCRLAPHLSLKTFP